MSEAATAAGSVVSSRKCHSDLCPCQQFQSDDETVILSSAVELDVKADALINWLAGSVEGEITIDSHESSSRCANRLRASITILNAIRDACRPFLETTSVNPEAKTETIKKVSTKNEQPDNNNQSIATYEDSFPPLSFTSAAISAPPTLLVGRKKKKDQKKIGQQQHRHEQSAFNQANASYEDSFPPVTLAPNTAAPTLLVGRKKKKNVPQNGKTHDVSKLNLNAGKTIAPKETKINTSKESAHGGSSTLSDGSIAPVQSQHNKTKTPSSPVKKLDQLYISDHTYNPTDTECKPIEKEKLKRIAAIYCAILKSHLAPFILLELHLLMRLISLSDTVEKFQSRPINNKMHVLGAIFQSEACCIYFVSQALVSLEKMIINMGYETIKMFLGLPALQQHCPTLVATLKDTMNRDKAILIFETGQKALGSDSKTPHLTLPFDHERDSRHNYRSLDLSRLFKEREELRDSFLYQLRAFQEVRGKLMGNEESDNIINSIKQEAREMMKNVSPGNVDWFVNLFCDLLLQIGLLPVGETDSEVLRHVTDKKRLQKLHMRFTSKSGQKSKSSRKLSLDQKGSSLNEVTPEQSFQGHQEFFFMVLQAGDSYRFNTHLKRRLARSISEMSTANETKGLCLHIAKLQLLAKFLGLLVFSPNWDLSSERGCDVSDANSLPPLDLKMHITKAWNDYRLVVVIPWVVKFLSMMRWDVSSKKLPCYAHTFAVLWTINLHCSNEATHHLQTNMFMVRLQLDALFHDVVGLVSTQNLPTAKLPSRAATNPSDSSAAGSPSFTTPKSLPLDSMPLWFSKQFLISSIPYFEDLFQLLSDLTSKNIRPGNSGTKKVRPRSISLGSLNSGQKYVSRISLGGTDASPSPWSSSRPGTPTDKNGIKERLIDSFFHQHKVLQELCEVIVDRVIKNASHTIKLSCVQPMFTKGGTDYEEYFNTASPVSLGDYTKMLESLGDDCKVAGDKLVRHSFSKTIKGALTLLAPPDTDSHVLEIASSLATSHAIKLGEQIVLSAVSDAKSKLSEEFARKESKSKAGVPLQHSTKVEQSHQRHIDDTNAVVSKFQSLADLTMALKVVCDKGVCCEKDFLQLEEVKQKVTIHVEKYFIGCDSSLQTIQHFETQVVSCLTSFFSEPGQLNAPLRAAVEVMDILSLLNMMGYLSSSAAELESLICNITNLQTLINGPLRNDEIGKFLFVMIEGSLISHLSLEGVFLQLVRDDDSAKAVAYSLFRLQDSEGQAIMVRLRKLLL